MYRPVVVLGSSVAEASLATVCLEVWPLLYFETRAADLSCDPGCSSYLVPLQPASSLFYLTLVRQAGWHRGWCMTGSGSHALLLLSLGLISPGGLGEQCREGVHRVSFNASLIE